MELIKAFGDLFLALYHVLAEFAGVLAPLLPLLVWAAFWTLAVDWVKLRHFFLRGGWVAILLLMFVTILIWGVVAPPESGRHHLAGLSVSNFVGKTMFVTAIFVITMICGSVQLSGLCGKLCQFEPDESEPVAHGH